jgi:hypothetical protein
MLNAEDITHSQPPLRNQQHQDGEEFTQHRRVVADPAPNVDTPPTEQKVVVFVGETGSGKTSACRILR